MRERLEGAALLLILTLALLADGLMESLGLGGFVLVSAITLTAAGIRRKAPCITADQSRMQETYTNHHNGGRVQLLYHGPRRKIKRR